MLVLSRKKDQTIRIGSDIEITICKVQGNRVSLAINAPMDVPVMRGELLKADDRPKSTDAPRLSTSVLP